MTQKKLTDAQADALRCFSGSPVATPRSDVTDRLFDAGLITADLALTDAGRAALGSRGMTQTAAPQTLTAPFTGDQFRSADLNTVQLFFRDGQPVILGCSLHFLLGSWEGDFDGMAANLTEIDAERAGERG